MDNLNKENFFDEMTELFPEAMAHFCAWIDDYKKEANWVQLFNEGFGYWDTERSLSGSITRSTQRTKAPKFHDIPFEMQIGILFRYVKETFDESDDMLTTSGMMVLFRSCLEAVQSKLC